MKILVNTLVFILCFSSSAVFAGELGNFRFTNYHVETELVAGDDSYQSSGFHLGRSFISFSWDKSDHLGGELQVSSNQLVHSTRWYNTSYSHESIFSLAYAFYRHNETSKWTMGLQEVPFGLESYLGVALWELPTSLFWKQKYISYSDVGLGFRSSAAGIKSHMLIHNGYGVLRDRLSQNDDRFFYSARVSVENESGEFYGLSAQFGQFKRNSETILRKTAMYNLFGMAKLFGGFASLDGTWGNDKSDTDEEKFYFALLQYRYPFTSSFSLIVRAEQLEPNKSQSSDIVDSASIGLQWNDANANSRIYLALSQTKKEQGQNDQVVTLNWKLSSLYNKRYRK